MADTGIQEGEGLSWVYRLDPEGHLAEFDGKGVAVDTVNAVSNHLAQDLLPLVFVRRSVPGFQDGYLGCQASCGGQQEVTGTAGGVDDLQLEQGRDGIGRIAGNGLLDDGIQCGTDELVHQRGGRVVGTGQLALAPSGVLFDEGEGRLVGLRVDGGVELEEALVDGSQFFGVHVPIVDAGESVAGLEEGEVADRFQEMEVVDGGVVDVWAMIGVEETAECGNSQRRRSFVQGLEGDLESFPEVVLVVVVPTPQGSFANSGQRVSLGVDLFLGVGGLGIVEEIAILYGKQEDQPIDEAQQLIVQIGRG